MYLAMAFNAPVSRCGAFQAQGAAAAYPRVQIGAEPVQQGLPDE